MKKSHLCFAPVFISLLFCFISCKKKDAVFNVQTPISAEEKLKIILETPFDSTLITRFFEDYKMLIKYKEEVVALYHKQNYRYIWFDNNGINEIGNLLYSKILNLKEEGINDTIPYKTKLDSLFQNTTEGQKPNIEDELLISSLYFYYANKVFRGIDNTKINELEWYLPRKKQSYINYLDSLFKKPSLLHKDEKEVLGQYYRLREVLKNYKQIEQKKEIDSIVLDPDIKSLQPGDSSQTIQQIRKWLYVFGDLKTNSKSAKYDSDLEKGVLNFKKRFSFAPLKTLALKHINAMNVPLSERIKTLIVNMERCRWISADIEKSKEFIVINIPAYHLTYFKNNKVKFATNVVVGKTVNQTVVFSADMKYIVFSPYWNIPTSIIEKEIKPGIAKNPNYLANHNMEWNNGNVRQKPGSKNSLGLVKFLFPNSNAIYLHDTPSKSLFNEEKRAFSHGCIRVEKPDQLANAILDEDPNWTPEKIDSAMHKGKESWYTLKNKIPVYIGYFTSWVDNSGNINFYDDVYKRDEKLAAMLLEK